MNGLPASDNYEALLARQHRMGFEADAVLRLGVMHMAAGTGGYRVMRAMKRAARALGFDRLDAVISVNTISCTFHRGNAFRTVVANQQDPAVNASRIEALEDLTHHMHHTMTAEELNAALDAIEKNVTHRWPRRMMAIASGLACAAFAYLNHFPLAECSVVGVAAFGGQFVRSTLAKRHFNQLGTSAVSGTAACLIYYAVTMIIAQITPTDPASFAAGYVASVLFLIPGFPLFSSLLDLTRFDFTAGLSRLTYALSIIIVATITVGMVSMVTGQSPLPPNPGPPDTVWFIGVAIASFIGVAGFSVLFNCSRRMVTINATIALFCNTGRFLLLTYVMQPQFAAFIAGLSIGLIVAAIASYARVPRITMTVPASVIMIPGVAMYRSIYYLNISSMEKAIANASFAILIVIMIAAGLAAARMLTDRDWAFGQMIDFKKPLEAENEPLFEPVDFEFHFPNVKEALPQVADRIPAIPKPTLPGPPFGRKNKLEGESGTPMRAD